MAEVFGVAASAMAVIELSIKVVSLCLQYSKDVKHARDDIARLVTEVTALKTITEDVQQLLNGPQGARLKTSQKLRVAIKEGHNQLEKVKNQLGPSKARKAMKLLGIRAIKWPFESKDIQKAIDTLARCVQTMSLSLQVDQTSFLFTVDENIRNRDHKATLNQLPIAQEAAFDSHAEEHNRTCLEGTRVDLLDKISKWIENPEAKTIFWLNGMAGTGKSTISRTVAGRCNEQKILGASFFFKRGEGDRGGVSKFFTTIASQLVFKQPHLAPHVQNAIDSDPSIIGKALREQFEKLILEPLSKISQNVNTLVILIDALDECNSDKDIGVIINLLSQTKTLKSSRLRVFVTSRPELPIRLGFSGIQGTYQNLVLHEIPNPIIEQDISTFLKHELEIIRANYNNTVPQDRQLPLTWPDKSSTQGLVMRAIPLFIFAATLCRFLADRRCGSPNRQLQKVLQYQTRSHVSKLDVTYMPVLDQLLVGLSTEESAEVLAQFQLVVGSIILLESPLTIPALARMLHISEDTINNRLDLLHSVINMPSSSEYPVRLFHLSFREFLIHPDRRGKSPFWIDDQDAHNRIATHCLRVMKESLQRDICRLYAPGTLISIIDPQKIIDNIRPEVQYACRYWAYHLQQASAFISDDHEVYTFLNRHFLHWLEALSLIGRASESLGMIKILQSIVQPDSNKTLTFLNDASRFILFIVSIIQQAPLQVYSSALAFAPKQSVIRSVFKQEMPGWISPLPKVEDNWSACQQTLEGHSDWVNSVAFSHDSKLVASASDDKTVRIWSADTGACQQSFNIGTDSEKLCFNDNGLYLYTDTGTISLEDLVCRVKTSVIPINQSSKNVSDLPLACDDQDNRSGYGISTDKAWITTYGRRLLWLPPNYRPSCSAVSHSTIAIGTGQGMVRIMRFVP